ncbi:MAG: aldehyde dehydrogenase [Solirubrobacterales bacterium]|nr:aldehyde dehydrogenase [Solirubrobacterales bacterium]
MNSVNTTASTPEALDQEIGVLRAGADSWSTVPLGDRVELLERLALRIADVAEEWVDAAATAKGLEQSSQLVGEEWVSGPWALIAGVRALAETLAALDRGALPFSDRAVSERSGGQVVVDVYPTNPIESLLLHGYHAEVWQQPEVRRSNLRESVGRLYREGQPDPGVCAVMGAGNIAAITPLDILHALFAEGRTVAAKLSPVNDYLGPFLERAFGEFTDRGWVRFLYGGAEVGERLVDHEEVVAVHVTGSAATYDAIVFGTGPDGAERRAAGTPRLDKPVTAELGGVSPAIVVPGAWTDADLRYQAEHVATQKLHNAGHNCIATQVIVLPADWEHADRFAELVAGAIAAAPARDPYYPGSKERHEAVLGADRDHLVLGGATPPRTVAPDVAPDSNDRCFSDEAFGGHLAITRLPGGTDEYLRAAVEFANDRLAGTLGANLLVDPKTARAHAAALDSAIAGLRYGTVGVNAWVGVGFLLARASWGAYPGATPADIQSGVGVVHNACLFDHPQKTVVRAPFRPFPAGLAHGSLHLSPKPPWFVTNRTAKTTSRRLTDFAAKPSLTKLPGIFYSALRG